MSFLPIVLSLLVLAAHFLRSGGLLLTIAVLGLIPLLVFRRPWVARVTQLVLVLGSFEWIRTLMTLASLRSQHGQPYLRMVVILGVVAATTLVSALLFETRRLRSLYGTTRSAGRSGEDSEGIPKATRQS